MLPAAPPKQENQDSGLGNGDSGLGADSRKPTADSGCRNQISAYRFPLAEFAYHFQ